MRIGFFADMYKPHTSGVTNQISLLKQWLESQGHEVWVLTFGDREYADDEPNVVRSPGIPWGETGWRLGLGLSAEAKEVTRSLDIAHTHHPFLSGRLVLRQCEPLGIPVVFTNHTRYDIYSDAYASYIPRPARIGYLRSYLRRFCSEVDLVVSPSPGIAEWLREFGVTGGAVVVPNGIDADAFAHPQRPWTHADLGLPENAVVACYLGRLGPEKNLPMLVDAFVMAASRSPRLALLLIGDGPSREAAEERIAAEGLSDRVVFAGLVPYADVPDRIAAADLFATASVSEVHPLTPMEAMAAGLPCVGVVSPGVGDIVRDGETGFLTSEDATAFAARLTDLAEDDSLRARLSGNARSAAAGFDISVTGDTLVRHYERLIATHRA